MCGIIGAVAQRNIVNILLEGLRLLEYRGYDSAGLAVINHNNNLQYLRKVGKVNTLVEAVKQYSLSGETGIAHTRWATHGNPTESNAHPHISNNIIIVHNGIIENYQLLRDILRQRGYSFLSETDTEVIAHLIHWEQCQKNNLLTQVIQRVIPQLHGTYSIVIMDNLNPSRLVAARSGSPLIIGRGEEANFFASDQRALLPVTRRFIFLEEGDIAEITNKTICIWNNIGKIVERAEIVYQIKTDMKDIDKSPYCHYMQKEIYEQPLAIKNTIEKHLCSGLITMAELGPDIDILLRQVQHVQIIACGTSYHSAMVSRYWLEALAKLPCDIEIASEFRYRKSIVRSGSLLITLSQSGETADTLAALRLTKNMGYLGSLTICNVACSTLVRESDFVLITNAGTEISVASTKSFTTQLTLLLMFVIYIARIRGINKLSEKQIVHALQKLPSCIEQILLLDQAIKHLAEVFINKEHALFLGRGTLYPIAMEGALKLKEISYIHAEAYAAGELKHGPLALINPGMPVIVIVSNNELLDKLKSNIEEVRTRGGQLYIFAEKNITFTKSKEMKVIFLPNIEPLLAPIYYAVPMQMLAYHIALIKGTDVDQPRNLAKSVTV
ncbi:glutamine--fructose-6-phosphate transaminase (isomerizing) [Candidatus Palibaumannia cicadellinicola]|uniref:Glutamine--fructose-6-phosphate aminotransferase [isomerizing] n=1 Tax=Candidatus Palibaumannia cicadellinicola TaxID=186490 RepID=A0A2N4XXN5_9GAMM|nr:glutamine--fructose-6-phosphate transaminase (isomerizing) [Candidatus Baumannia cicadellinicola]PLK59425.1 glutamine--fructose-6-phosphate transaminase (isomerizing) [Candidatus Baumannia cicadellinicola]